MSVDITQLGTILGVWAHPDDESWASAGIMAQAVRNGQRVICITATKGELGIQDEARWPRGRLGDIRAAELAAGLKVLGVREHHWLDCADGGCEAVPVGEGADKIKAFIERYKPDTILTFGPEGLTGHPDHASMSRWVEAATKDTDIAVYHAVQLRELYEKLREADDQFNIFFNIDQPPLVSEEECDLFLRLSDELQEVKFRCLSAMPSQTEAMLKQFGRDIITEMLCCEAFVRVR